MSSKSSVASIVLSENQQEILLIKRRDVPIWVLPGGGVEPNEAPEDAVIREMQEETGLSVAIIRQTAFYTPVNTLATDTYVYECRPISGMLTIGDETTQIGYFPLKNLPKPFFFIHGQWIEDALLHHPGIVQKPLSDVTYLGLLRYFCRHPLQVLRFLMSRLGLPFNSKD